MRYRAIAIVLFTLVFSHCKTVPVSYFPNAELVYLQSEGDQLTLQTLGYGTTEQNAVLNAQISAFDNLFFRGIPNSPYSNPLIGLNENDVKRNNRNYFAGFYGGKRLLNFINGYNIIASDKTVVLAKKIKNKKVEQGNVRSRAAYIEIIINVKSLRKDLEANKVIKPFGY